MADSSKKKKKPVKMSLAEFQSAAAQSEPEPPRRDQFPQGSNILYVWNVPTGTDEQAIAEFFQRHKVDGVKRTAENVFAVKFATSSDMQSASILDGTSFRSSRLYFGDSADKPPAKYANRHSEPPREEPSEDRGYDRGYGQRDGGRDGGYGRREGGGYDRREGGGGYRREGGYERRDEGREGGFERREGGGGYRREGGFGGGSGYGRRDGEGGGFRDRDRGEGGFDRREGGREGGFQRREGGFERREGEGGFDRREGGGFRDRSEGGFRDRGDDDGSRDRRPPPSRSDTSDNWRSEARVPAPVPQREERSGGDRWTRRGDSERPREPQGESESAPPRGPPRINLDALRTSLASSAPAAEAPRSGASPFGAARPVDTASKLEQITSESAEKKAASPVREPAAREQPKYRPPRENAGSPDRPAPASTPAKSAREKAPPAEGRRQEPAVVNKFQGLTVEGDDE